MIRATLLAIALALTATAAAPGDDKIDFVTRIQPILVEHCAKCHGADKALGKLRLDTAAGIQEKLAAKPQLILAGTPDESELYKRLVLPDKNPKRMPKGADPLPKDTIGLVAKWIKQGAAIPADVVAEPTPPEKPAEEPAEKPSDKPVEKSANKPAQPVKDAEAAALPEVTPAPQEAIDRLSAANVQVTQLFGGSSLLAVSFAHRDQPAGDAEVALLAGVADQVYALDLAQSKLSDAALSQLAALKNLSTLHLERSSVSDEELAHLAGLDSLQYLNLYGTGITDAGLKHLAGLTHLQKLYLWQTKVSYDAATALEKNAPGLVVNLGFNHPVVAKLRLTKEMETAKKQAEEAKAEAAKVEQQLAAAKKNQEASDARVAEIEKQLKALEPPTDAEDEQPPVSAAASPVESADKKPADKAAAPVAAAKKKE